MTDVQQARKRAEAAFKKKEAEAQGLNAMQEYRASERATREKTARLRALRLAREQGKKPG